MRRVPVTGVAARWNPWRWVLEDVAAEFDALRLRLRTPLRPAGK